MIHDVAVAIRSLQAAGKIRTAMTVDTDVHHGNGTAAIFADDPSVFTLSIHQENNYPMPKPPSDEDIGLEDGTRDHEYLDALEEGLLHALKKMTPDMIFYVGGADPYREDQLGGLALTIEGLQKRDRLVFEHARAQGNPSRVHAGGRIRASRRGYGSNSCQHDRRRARRCSAEAFHQWKIIESESQWCRLHRKRTKCFFVIPSEARDLLFFSKTEKKQIPRANPALRNDTLRVPAACETCATCRYRPSSNDYWMLARARLLPKLW